MTKLLMISGDRMVAQGKQGAFYATLKGLSKHMERIDVICPRVPVQRYNMVLFGNVYIHPAPVPRLLQSLWIWWRGRQLVRQHQSQVVTVHEYAPFYNGVGAWLLWLSVRVPTIVEVMHIPGIPRASTVREVMYRWMSRIVLPWTTAYARVVRVINQHETVDFLQAAGVPASRMQCVPAFYLDTKVFAPQADIEKRFDVVWAGRFVSNKNLPFLLSIIERGNLSGLLVGEGPLKGWVARQVKKRGLHVTLGGFARDAQGVADHMRSARLLVMTSLNEGGPRVVVEALACGVPVVATGVGIVPDVLGPECIIDHDDVDGAVQKIQAILGDQATYEKLSSQGVFSTQEFEYDTAIQNYAEFITSHARHE
jgi:glycosyltransferase involved in cell wall biosynthesis